MKLVIYPPVEGERLARIVDAVGDGVVENVADEAAAERAIVDADALFGKLTPQMLAAATRLRWVQAPTASLEHYIFDALVEHPCALTNMRGLYSDVIADHVFGYIIAFARNLPFYIRNQMARRWEPAGGEGGRSTFTAGPGTTSPMDRAHLHLADATLGIVGLGSIGREVARRAAAFDMRIVAVDPQAEDWPPEVQHVWPPEQLGELLGASDFVVIAAPHTPETERSFTAEQFQQMKPTAYLVNIGRGAIVDLADLVASLEAGHLAGAALDVFETEPLPAEHPLWRFDNVILTPHVAGCSPRIAERHLAVLLDNIGRFRRDQPLRNVVRKDQWY